MSIPEFVGAGLIINKMVDSEAQLKRGQIDYRKLSDKYNQLVNKYNSALDHIDKQTEQLKDITEKAAFREKELLDALSYQTREVEQSKKEIFDLTERLEVHSAYIDKLNKEKDVRLAVQMTVMRIQEEIPEEIRMRAMAKIMAENTPESLNREFVIDCGEEIEPKVQNQIFPNRISNLAKYNAYKKEAIQKLDQPLDSREENYESASMR